MTTHEATHFVIPDTQVKPGVPIDHLRWIGRYIAEKASRKNVTIVHLGDHWDMPSLSSYDKGKKAMEGRRVAEDVAAGIRGMETLTEPLNDRTLARSSRPRRILLRGNHEHRITRAIESDAQLDGLLSLDLLEAPGWETHGFLEPVVVDGVTYSHYLYNPMNGRPYAGMIETRLKTIGFSFTMGHQQTLMYGVRPVGRSRHHGLVAGSCYLHDEEYRGPQSNQEWRGIVVCHEVRDGIYDPMFVSLDYLCRRFEGKPLSAFKPKLVA